MDSGKNTIIPPALRLAVLFRLEPGCLGPDGSERIDDFCRYAQPLVAAMESPMTDCEIVPRRNVALPEIEYRMNSKKLNREQASRYLEKFGTPLRAFEENLDEFITQVIDQYLDP